MGSIVIPYQIILSTTQQVATIARTYRLIALKEPEVPSVRIHSREWLHCLRTSLRILDFVKHTDQIFSVALIQASELEVLAHACKFLLEVSTLHNEKTI